METIDGIELRHHDDKAMGSQELGDLGVPLDRPEEAVLEKSDRI